jgi:hypothetical protein
MAKTRILCLTVCAFLLVPLFSLNAEEPSESGADAQIRREMIEELPAPILYVSRPQYKSDHHNTATLFQKGEINEASFVGGGSMRVWFPETGEVKTLLILPEGIVRDPTIDFDGKKVLFSFRKSVDDAYHIGEMTLDFDRPAITLEAETPTDGIEGFRQLTFLGGISDIDPIYLPDGRILFSSTRQPKYCMCNRHIMGNLFVMNEDGSNIEQIGKSTLFEGHPSLLADGRIIYDRWEYVDRNFGDAQGVWVTNPDGTKHEIFWGNNTASPGGVIDARALPGSDSTFICVFGSCHDRPWGAIALVDRRLGTDGRDAVLMTWPDVPRHLIVSEAGEDPMKPLNLYDTFCGLKQKFEDPFPITDDFFLASGSTEDGVMAIWGLDTDQNIILLHQDPESCFDPMPIAATSRPPVIGNRVDLTQETGTFVVSNVYEGNGMENVEPGSVKYLRVVESPEKRFWTSEYWETTGTQAPAMTWDDFNNKRILGDVPVNKDGSVSFEVPAEKFLYFQLLDEDKLMIQSMRSGIMVRPGETNACVGCHEDRLDAPASANLSVTSITGEAKKLEPWYGEPRLFSYLTEVQPVFDKYCVACHDYGKPAADKLNLARDRNMIFNTSYYELRMKRLVRVPGAGPHNLLSAHEWGARESILGKVLLSGHLDPMIDRQRKAMGLWLDKDTDRESFERVMTWIDINAPYYPTYGTSYREGRYGRCPISLDEMKRLQTLTGAHEWEVTFGVSFDRPELSPCLARLVKDGDLDAARRTPEYQEALAIIRRGAEALARQDRGEDPNWEPTDPIEVAQQAKYLRFAEREKKVRQAILNGERLTDRDFLKDFIGDKP